MPRNVDSRANNGSPDILLDGPISRLQYSPAGAPLPKLQPSLSNLLHYLGTKIAPLSQKDKYKIYAVHHSRHRKPWCYLWRTYVLILRESRLPFCSAPVHGPQALAFLKLHKVQSSFLAHSLLCFSEADVLATGCSK